MYLFKTSQNAEAPVSVFSVPLDFCFFHQLILFVGITFSCAVDFPLYWQRAGIKEYQFTYTVLIKCNKIPPKDIINVLFLL